MERYSEYKPTTIQWLKEIPSHWEVLPLKRCLNVPLMYGANEAPDGENYNLPRYIRITDINDIGKLKKETFKSLSREKALPYMLRKGDILFARSGATVGKSYIFDEDGEACFAGYLIKAQCSGLLLPQFLFRYTQSDTYDLWKSSIFIQSTIPNIGADKYATLPIPLPPLAEQEKIVSYLEGKTSKIDAYVAEKEKEIQLLQELKQKTIADAVTKGLNPDVKMKDSGISWIGMIPEHWKQYRFATILKEKSICNQVSEELLSVYLDRGVIRFSDDSNKRTNPTSKDLSKYQLVEKGDFVLNNQQAWRGSVGVSRFRGIISPAYFIFSMTSLLDVNYANYLFRSNNCVAFYHICSKGIGSIQRNLDWGALRQKRIALPPLSEQRAIVAYIDEKCQKIDTLMTELQAEIDYMKEYKQRLIADCVTGQVNVQNETI